MRVNRHSLLQHENVTDFQNVCVWSYIEQCLPGIKGNKDFNTSFFPPFTPPQRQYQLQKSCGPLWEKYRFQKCQLHSQKDNCFLFSSLAVLVHNHIFLKGLTILLLPEDLLCCCLYILSLENIGEFRTHPG